MWTKRKSSEPPDGFDTAIEAYLTRTWHSESHLRTGMQVLSFANKVVHKSAGFVVHEFEFEFDSIRYAFRVVGEQGKGLSLAGPFFVQIDPSDLTKCWMNKHLLNVHLWEPDED
jgi:hypothetical protein